MIFVGIKFHDFREFQEDHRFKYSFHGTFRHLRNLILELSNLFVSLYLISRSYRKYPNLVRAKFDCTAWRTNICKGAHHNYNQKNYYQN